MASLFACVSNNAQSLSVHTMRICGAIELDRRTEMHAVNST